MAEGKKNLPGEAELRLEDGFDALDAIVGCLSQSKEWAHIQRHDALIQKAEDAVYHQLEQIRAVSGEDCFQDLEDTISVYTGTLNDAAILYGMRMAVKLFYAFGRPMEMSRYFLAHDVQEDAGGGYGRTY